MNRSQSVLEHLSYWTVAKASTKVSGVVNTLDQFLVDVSSEVPGTVGTLDCFFGAETHTSETASEGTGSTELYPFLEMIGLPDVHLLAKGVLDEMGLSQGVASVRLSSDADMGGVYASLLVSFSGAVSRSNYRSTRTRFMERFLERLDGRSTSKLVVRVRSNAQGI